MLSGPEFLRANAGFAYDYQFIDVGDYQGQGESCPVPYFYQVPASIYQGSPCTMNHNCKFRLAGYRKNRVLHGMHCVESRPPDILHALGGHLCSAV